METTFNSALKTWADQLDRKEHLALVSSLYGPGATGCWLMLVCSVVVSWLINGESANEDRITNDFIGALTLPAVAGGHLIHQLIKYPGPRASMFTTTDPMLTPRVAAIEASLSICETFSAMALPLAAISMYKKHPRRFFVTLSIGLFCFVLETMLTILSPIPSLDETNLNRTPLIHGKAFVSIITTVIGLLVAFALYVWIQITWITRQARKMRRDQEAQNIELQTLKQQLQAAADQGNDAAVTDLRRKIHSHIPLDETSQQARNVAWLSFLTIVFLPVSLFASMMGLPDGTAIGSFHSLAWRLRFFIPESNTSIKELDQVVALAGGAVTLTFSCYDAYRSRKEGAGD